jgi:hypothetical protein
MADEETRAMIIEIERDLRENGIGIWEEEDSEEEKANMELIDLD